MTGIVAQINVRPQSFGRPSLPKQPILTGSVRTHGLTLDYNHYRETEKGGDPARALLIFPNEMINTLNKEGWLMKPGDLGENITTAGIEYKAFAPGKKYMAGEIVFEITEKCNPCSNLAALWYVGEDRLKKFIETLKNRRGWYARVLKEGTIKEGDTVQEIE